MADACDEVDVIAACVEAMTRAILWLSVRFDSWKWYWPLVDCPVEVIAIAAVFLALRTLMTIVVILFLLVELASPVMSSGSVVIGVVV